VMGVVTLTMGIDYFIAAGEIRFQTPEEYLFQSMGSTYEAYQQLLRDDFETITRVSPKATAFQISSAILILIFLIRMMKCVQYEGKIGLVTKMLLESCDDMLHLMIFLVFFWLGLSCSAMALFGHANDSFANVGKAWEALFFYAFGIEVFSYEHISDLSPILAPIFCLFYLVVSGLVLFNVFIAVLMDAYGDVKPQRRMQASLAEETQEGWTRRWRRITGKASNYSDVYEVIDTLEEWWPEPEKRTKHFVAYNELKERLGDRPFAERTDTMIIGCSEELENERAAEEALRLCPPSPRSSPRSRSPGSVCLGPIDFKMEDMVPAKAHDPEM